MARRVLVLSLIASLALAATAFAAGQNEPAGTSATTGPKLTLTGPVEFANLIHPTLTSGGKVYELLIPRMLVYRAGIKEGAPVTVEAYQATTLPPGMIVPDGVTPVFVTKATINGKDYDLSQYYGRGMMGGGWGGGYGPGYGRGMMGGGGWGMMGGGGD